MFLLTLCFVAASVFLSGEANNRRPLTEFIKHHETLSYSTSYLQKQYGRHRRSDDPKSNPILLYFSALRRKFRIRLRRDTSIFSSDFTVDNVVFDPFKVVKGEVLGYDKSLVHGFILDGVFEGKIHINNDEYHVEHAKKYFKGKQPFHSVIYHSRDVHYPFPHGSGCGLSDKTKQWMRKVQSSVVEDSVFEGEHSKYEPVIQRYRRAVSPVDDNKKACTLYMQADHLFTKYIAGDSKERAVLLMTEHVRAVNTIYHATDFNGDGRADGIVFVVGRMLVNDSSDTGGDNPYSNKNIGVEKLLEINSQQRINEEFCLAYIFTYRDFDNGVLGLAWVGEPNGAAGGICEKFKKFSDGYKILNTGVVTFINYGKNVPQKVSEITFAHEAGHNFGSPHDESSVCSPGGTEGNYIMFPRATSGDKPNNRKFSSCSKSKMNAVLESKGICTDAKCCFTRADSPICGNKVVEKGEQCDCGYADEDSCKKDKCCLGKVPGQETGCTYKGAAHCSPSEGLCCDPNLCQPRTGNDTYACQNETSCRNISYCNGINATCPTAPFKLDHTVCEGGRKLCVNGTCQGSICLKKGYKECQCLVEGEECDLCCDVSTDPKKSVCKSTFKIAEMKDLKQHAGSPCNNFNGYCDVFLKCRQVDADGPLNRLRKMFFSKEAIMSYVDWIKTYWWAVVLIGVGLILLMAGFIKLCSVHTPSSNPNRKPARQLTLRRQQQQQQQQRNRQARQQQREHDPSNEGYPGPSCTDNPPPYPGRPLEMRHGKP